MLSILLLPIYPSIYLSISISVFIHCPGLVLLSSIPLDDLQSIEHNENHSILFSKILKIKIILNKKYKW